VLTPYQLFIQKRINNYTMISKDADLIGEAYLSALQKQKNVTTEPAMEDIAEINPEVTDRENVEMAVAVPAGPEAMGAMDQATPIGAELSDQAHEESEEAWMVRSNLFSLFTNAKKIHNLMQTGIDPEPWAQQKVAVCADNLEAVMKYIAYEAAEKGLSC
jgi:chemotaxis regulatin CheY-phosphate phosphatase CheZ